jgi:Domain of unknown function (DUF6458)
MRIRGYKDGMRIGAALFLFAVGAILKWAVTAHVRGINLHVVGVILMFVGIVGLVLELIWWQTGRRSPFITRTPNATYIDERDLVDRPTYPDEEHLVDRP